jgi:hypothetical protein
MIRGLLVRPRRGVDNPSCSDVREFEEKCQFVVLLSEDVVPITPRPYFGSVQRLRKGDGVPLMFDIESQLHRQLGIEWQG